MVAIIMHTVKVALIPMAQIAITITNNIYILQPLQRIDKALTIKKQMWQMSRNHLPHLFFDIESHSYHYSKVYASQLLNIYITLVKRSFHKSEKIMSQSNSE